MFNGIIGICRFSFLGLGDWATYNGRRDARQITPEVLAEVGRDLYAPLRMARRFWLFEHLMLPSIRAQTDQDFTLLLLTSPEMPQQWQDRARALIADLPNVRLLVTDARTSGGALIPELARFRAEHGGHPVQFRIDDDDALASDYIASVREAAARMDGLPAFAVTLPRVIVAHSYHGAPVQYARQYRLFHSAGTACYLENPKGTIFQYAHHTWGHKVANIVLPETTGAVMTRFDGHDSQAVFQSGTKAFSDPVPEVDRKRIFALRFAHLSTLDYAPLLAMAGPAADQTASGQPA